MKLHNFIITNGDTDSISFKKPDESPFTPEERKTLLAEINSFMPELIKWEDDDYFPKFIVVRTKNYVMLNEKGKVKIKGSGLKGAMKEKALQRFQREVIDMMLAGEQDLLVHLYESYVRQILSLKDMSDWSFKITVTKSVLKPKVAFSAKKLAALEGKTYQEGDKFFMYFRSDDSLACVEDFDGDYLKTKLLGKLYGTIKMFKTVIDIKQFPNYTLKRNQKALEGLICQ